MEKRRFNITIITEEQNQNYQILGEYDKDKKVIEYIEKDDFSTKMKIDFTNKKLIRENQEYRITYNLKLNQTTRNEIILKKIDKKLEIEIKVNKFTFTEKDITLDYVILESNEQIIYKIEIEEK